jgi:hypothetical protein
LKFHYYTTTTLTKLQKNLATPGFFALLGLPCPLDWKCLKINVKSCFGGWVVGGGWVAEPRESKSAKKIVVPN